MWWSKADSTYNWSHNRILQKIRSWFPSEYPRHATADRSNVAIMMNIPSWYSDITQSTQQQLQKWEQIMNDLINFCSGYHEIVWSVSFDTPQSLFLWCTSGVLTPFSYFYHPLQYVSKIKLLPPFQIKGGHKIVFDPTCGVPTNVKPLYSRYTIVFIITYQLLISFLNMENYV